MVEIVARHTVKHHPRFAMLVSIWQVYTRLSKIALVATVLFRYHVFLYIALTHVVFWMTFKAISRRKMKQIYDELNM